MTIWKYLRDQWLVFIGWGIFISLTILVLWLTPAVHFNFSIVSYLVLLEGLLLLLYFLIDYSLKRRWWQALDISNEPPSLQHYFQEASKNQEKLVQEYINAVLIEHQQTLQQAIDIQQDQKEYIDSWVHEIKVPLSAAALVLQSIEEEITEDKYNLLENELNKIDEYVEQVLYYARLDSFSKDYLIQEYSLKKIVQTVVRSQANYFIQKSLQVSIIGEDQVVLTDAKWLSFILKQLLSNAIKYTETMGRISFEMSQSQEGIWLKIKDTGIGIPKEDQKRIFDKGFTGENGRFNEQHATGLGLYLASQLAKQLGNQLFVESTVGDGTTISILFPFLTNFYTLDEEESSIG